jgi:hypothetical protein
MNTMHLAFTLTTSVRPIFGHWTPTVVSGIQIALGAAWIVAMRLSVMSTEELERLLGVAILDALDHARIPVKEAAAIMGCEVEHFRQAIRRDGQRC